MSILNLSDEFYQGLKELAIPERDIANLKMYLEICDDIIVKGKDDGWVNQQNYEDYKKLVANKKSLATKEIGEYYSLMAKIVVVSARENLIPKNTYYHYSDIANSAYDFIRALFPYSYSGTKKIVGEETKNEPASGE